jgi:hypothetical protein
MKLANLLKEYDIRPDTYRFTEGQAKGYRREDFTDAWNRYCPTPDEHLPAERVEDGDQGVRGSRTSRTSLITAGQPRYGFSPGTAPAVPTEQPLPGAWYGSSRTNGKAVPALTRQNEAGTAGTATSHPATCITCRQPMTYDDGTHTHPACATA